MPPSEDISPFEMACRATCKAEFVEALIRLLKESGLSYRQLAQKSNGQMPRSTAHNLTTKQQFPKREDQLQAFLAAFDIPAEAITLWVKEWQRVLAD